MDNHSHHLFVASLVVLAAAIGLQPARADDPYRQREPAPVVDANDDPYDPVLRYAVERESADEYLLTVQPETSQPETESAAETPAIAPRPSALTSRRRGRTYRLPSMFGDFGGNTLQLSIPQAPTVIRQVVVDGQNGVDLFVTNANGGNGADASAAVDINIFSQNSGLLLATSVGPGLDTDGPPSDGQPDRYPISEPLGSSPGIGFMFSGGEAVFVNGPVASPPPATLAAAPGSVGQGDGWALDFTHTFTPDPIVVNIPGGGGGGAVRRVKLSENNSPLPRTRLIWNYNFFNDVLGGIGDVNRYGFGFEYAYNEGMDSVDVRFPFAATLDSNQRAGTRATNTEFGDITMIFKHVLVARERFLMSAGMGLRVPTADDAHVSLADGTRIIHIAHESIDVMPFLGMLFSGDSGWYMHSFVQLDLDVNGDPIAGDLNGVNLQRIGVLQDQTLLFVDVGVGYWVTGAPGEGESGVAATAELHYASPLQDADTAMLDGLQITSVANRFDVVNLTLGANVLVGGRLSIRPAMVIPLNDDQFDYEAMVQMNLFR